MKLLSLLGVLLLFVQISLAADLSITRRTYDDTIETTSAVASIYETLSKLADVDSQLSPDDGDVLTWVAAQSLWKAVAPSSSGIGTQPKIESWTSDGSLNFTLAETPVGDVAVIWLNYIFQNPGVDYSVASNVVSFDGGAYPVGTNLIFVYAYTP